MRYAPTTALELHHGYGVAMTASRQTGEDAAPRRRRSQRQVQAWEANRAAIVRSALAAFAHHGYAGTTLQSVAEGVGLTRTGLLHHFGSKDGLFLEVIEEARRWAEHQHERSASGRGLDGVRRMRHFLGTAEDAVHLKFVHTVQGEALQNDAPVHVVEYVRRRMSEIRAHVEHYLREAQQDGEVGDMDVMAVSTLIAGAIDGLQAQWLLDDSVDTGAALDSLVTLLAGTRLAAGQSSPALR